MMAAKRTPEDFRYFAYRLGAHLAWWSAFAWLAVLTYVNLTRPAMALPNVFQRISGLFIILLMGVAIALGSALSRMRLARTITGVFQTGMDVGAVGTKMRQEQIIEMLRQEMSKEEADK